MACGSRCASAGRWGADAVIPGAWSAAICPRYSAAQLSALQREMPCPGSCLSRTVAMIPQTLACAESKRSRARPRRRHAGSPERCAFPAVAAGFRGGTTTLEERDRARQHTARSLVAAQASFLVRRRGGVSQDQRGNVAEGIRPSLSSGTRFIGPRLLIDARWGERGDRCGLALVPLLIGA